MDLTQWGFPELYLLEGEAPVMTIGSRHGVGDSAIGDREAVVLTTRRVLHLARGSGGKRAATCSLDRVEMVEVSSATQGIMTPIIGAVGLLGGLAGWWALPDSPGFLPWVGAVVAVMGLVLLVLSVTQSEGGALVFRIPAGELRLQFQGRDPARQAFTVIDRVYELQAALQPGSQEEAAGADEEDKEAPGGSWSTESSIEAPEAPDGGGWTGPVPAAVDTDRDPCYPPNQVR